MKYFLSNSQIPLIAPLPLFFELNLTLNILFLSTLNNDFPNALKTYAVELTSLFINFLTNELQSFVQLIHSGSK